MRAYSEKTLTVPRVDNHVEEHKPLETAGGHADTVQPLGATWRYLITVNIHLDYESSISHPCIYPGERCACVYTETWV